MKNLVIMILLLAIASCLTPANAATTDALLKEEVLAKWIYKHYLKGDRATAAIISQHIVPYSEKHNVDPFLVTAVMAVESSFKPNARNKKAKGLMQVIPRWHKEAVRGRNLHNPRVAVDVGSAILREYLDNNRGDVRKALSDYRGLSYKRCRPYVSKVLAMRSSVHTAYLNDHAVVIESSRVQAILDDSITDYVGNETQPYITNVAQQ